MAAGLEGPGRTIYQVYYPLCHQLPYRSWFLFGEQPTYSRQEFEERTGIGALDATGLLRAKAFVGDQQMGYKTAFCQRDVALYGGLLAAALIFGVVRHRVQPVHWLIWLAIGVGPIALDGFSQLFSVPSVAGICNPLWNPTNHTGAKARRCCARSPVSCSALCWCG